MNWMIAIIPLALLLLGFPIYIVLLASTSVIALLFMDIPLTLIPQVMFGSLDKFTLLAVPFFIFAGEIMSEGGISKRIVQWLLTMVGGFRGGLAFATVGACEFFGAVSGSSPATVAAIGRLMFPALRQGGYDEKFSLGLITSSGAIASVMPPSIVMILYGAAAEQSVAALFAGGVVPALLIGVLTAAYISWAVRSQTVHENISFRLLHLGARRGKQLGPSARRWSSWVEFTLAYSRRPKLPGWPALMVSLSRWPSIVRWIGAASGALP